MKFLMKDDDVVVLKSTNVDIGNGKNMLVLYYYHSDKTDKSKTFYQCNIRIDTKENWEKLRTELITNNPAGEFLTSMIGLDGNYRVYYSEHRFNRIDMHKFLGAKFSPAKTKTLDEFLSKEFLPSIMYPYLRTYNINGEDLDISEVNKIPEGQWFSALKEKNKKRKSYGTIIQ